jgi:hypothetical protein
MAGFYEMMYGGDAIEGDLDNIICNAVDSITPKWQTFKLLRWMQNFHQSKWYHEILHPDRYSEDKQLLIRPLSQKTKIQIWQGVEN